jgi:putative dimethyl sulfoxide reductase chaperone
MQQPDAAAAAENRCTLFWWLAEWFLGPPDSEHLDTLPPADGAAAVTPLDAAWQELSGARPRPDAATLERLGVEYTRLFAGLQEGLGPPPPYESVWREDRLIGESTVAVIAAYKQAGFADIEPAAGPQDHIAVELKFIALLALREAEAWRAKQPGPAARRQDQQRHFIAQHLAAWAPHWAATLARDSREPLYTAIAGLLQAGLEQAAAELAATAAG